MQKTYEIEKDVMISSFVKIAAENASSVRKANHSRNISEVEGLHVSGGSQSIAEHAFRPITAIKTEFLAFSS
jgi:hypothetical protein